MWMLNGPLSDLPKKTTSFPSPTNARTTLSSNASLGLPGGPDISSTCPRRTPPPSKLSKGSYLVGILCANNDATCVGGCVCCPDVDAATWPELECHLMEDSTLSVTSMVTSISRICQRLKVTRVDKKYENLWIKFLQTRL